MGVAERSEACGAGTHCPLERSKAVRGCLPLHHGGRLHMWDRLLFFGTGGCFLRDRFFFGGTGLWDRSYMARSQYREAGTIGDGCKWGAGSISHGTSRIHANVVCFCMFCVVFLECKDMYGSWGGRWPAKKVIQGPTSSSQRFLAHFGGFSAGQPGI